jgi:predicted DNA-binding transcriptional regulator AlpA
MKLPRAMNLIKVSEFAKEIGYSREIVYHWIRSGVIPASCVQRIGSLVRLDGEECMRLLLDGKLARPRTRYAPGHLNAEDSHTTRGGNLHGGSRCGHGFGETLFENERILLKVAEPFGEHPYSPVMKASSPNRSKV